MSQYRPLLFQMLDLIPTEAQLQQDFFVVLAVLGSALANGGAHSSRSLVAMISSRSEMRASRFAALWKCDPNRGSPSRSGLPNAAQKAGQYRSLSIMHNRSQPPHRAWS